MFLLHLTLFSSRYPSTFNAHLHPDLHIISNNPFPFLSLSLVSAPQALYKLYNVAANHRHLYHHAFPGPQMEEVAEEQDKKRDWLDKTDRESIAGTSVVMDRRRRRSWRKILTHQALFYSGVGWCLPTNTSTTLKPNNGLYNVHV